MPLYLSCNLQHKLEEKILEHHCPFCIYTESQKVTCWEINVKSDLPSWMAKIREIKTLLSTDTDVWTLPYALDN